MKYFFYMIFFLATGAAWAGSRHSSMASGSPSDASPHGHSEHLLAHEEESLGADWAGSRHSSMASGLSSDASSHAHNEDLLDPDQESLGKINEVFVSSGIQYEYEGRLVFFTRGETCLEGMILDQGRRLIALRLERNAEDIAERYQFSFFHINPESGASEAERCCYIIYNGARQMQGKVRRDSQEVAFDQLRAFNIPAIVQVFFEQPTWPLDNPPIYQRLIDELEHEVQANGDDETEDES